MSCRIVRDNLVDYLDSRVAPEIREAIESEMSTCAKCRSRIDEARLVRRTLADLPRHDAPADLFPEILARVNRERVAPANVANVPLASRTRIRPHSGRRLVLVRRVLTAACLLIAAAIGTLLVFDFEGASRPQHEVVFLRLDRDLDRQQVERFREIDPFGDTAYTAWEDATGATPGFGVSSGPRVDRDLQPDRSSEGPR